MFEFACWIWNWHRLQPEKSSGCRAEAVARTNMFQRLDPEHRARLRKPRIFDLRFAIAELSNLPTR